MKNSRHDYLLWLTATTSDSLASELPTYAIPFLILSVGGTVASAGFLDTVGQIIGVLIMLFGGVIVDRADRRSLMLWRGLTGALLWGTLGVLLVLNVLELWHIVVIVLASRAVRWLLGDSDDAALRSILPDNEEYARATSINQGRNAVIMLSASPLGGVLYQIGRIFPFATAIILHVIYCVSAVFIRTNLKPSRIARKSTKTFSGIFEDIRDGFVYLFHHRIRLSIVIFLIFKQAGTTMLGATFLYSLVAAGYSPVQVSLPEMVMAACMLAGSALSAKLITRSATGRVTIVTTVITLVVYALLIPLHSYFWLFVASAILGLQLPISSASLSGYIYATTPDNLQGRVMSAQMTLQSIFTVWTPAIAAGLVHTGHTAASYIVITLLTCGALAVALAVKSLRTLGTPSSWNTGSETGPA